MHSRYLCNAFKFQGSDSHVCFRNLRWNCPRGQKHVENQQERSGGAKLTGKAQNRNTMEPKSV